MSDPTFPANEPTLANEAVTAAPPRAAWAIELVRDSWKFVAKCAAIGAVCFVVVAFVIPTRYEAVARLMPPDQSGSSAALMSALLARGGDFFGGLAGESLGVRTPGATIVGVLTSRTVQDDIVNQFDLRKEYGKKRQEDARRVLAERSSISEEKKSGIITIAVQDHSPQRAAALARAYVDDLNLRVTQLTTSAAHRERVFLEERLQTVKQQLDDATLRLSQFSSKNRTMDPQIQAKAMLESAAALQGQLIAAETELSGLQQIYGAENYRVRAASARVGELRGKMRTMSGNGTDASQKSDGQFYPSLEQLPLLGNTYYDLARQAKIEEAVFEVLTKQYELAKVQEAKELPSIKVLDDPVAPERKSFPPRMLIVIFGTFFVTLCAAGWAFARQVWRKLDDRDPVKVTVREALAVFTPAKNPTAAGPAS